MAAKLCCSRMATEQRRQETGSPFERRPSALWSGALAKFFSYAALGVREAPALVTLPARMHAVQTRRCLCTPDTMARTRLRFGFQRRRRVLFAWLTTLPYCGPLPQRSHFIAMSVPADERFVKRDIVLYQRESSPSLRWQRFPPPPFCISVDSKGR